MTPFAFKTSSSTPKVIFATSGGYWLKVPEESLSIIQLIGQRDKLFKTWGHCGPCAGGSFNFIVPVNVWSYYAKSIY